MLSNERVRCGVGHRQERRRLDRSWDWWLGFSIFGLGCGVGFDLGAELGVHSGFRGWGLGRNVKRFRGGLACQAHRLLYHSTLGSRVIKKKKVGVNREEEGWGGTAAREREGEAAREG